MRSPCRKSCFKSVAIERSGTLILNAFWVILQLLIFSVEGRQTLPVRIETKSSADEDKEIRRRISNRDPGLAAAPSPSPWLEPPRGPDPPPVEPISITIIAIGALAGIIFIGAMCYLFCTRWTQLKDDSAWLPKDASRAEVLELMELIRVGTVDANGAPLHVINWMVHGADAPWPPPDGIKSLQKRRKGSCTMARSWINSSAAGASIELPQRIQPRRPREQSTMDLSTHYARKAELVSSHHYSAADIPQEYPLLPPGPNPHCQASAKILSHSSKQFLNNGAVEAETVMSPYTEISLHVDSEFESEVGSRRTTLREDGDLPFTALSPRPLSPRLHRQGCYLSLED